MLKDSEWKQIFDSPEGKQFKQALAYMFVSTSPNLPPEEAHYRSYWWNLRDVIAKRGLDLVIEGMEGAGRIADKFRPSAGSIRAHAERAAEKRGPYWGQKQLPERPFQPLTEEQLAEVREWRKQFGPCNWAALGGRMAGR